jgi:hypothetical protein
VEKIEQVVRLIRSKGVSVWFITQNPSDLPDSVLGQIGNRVQHALRAYTPNDQKALRAAARSFRVNEAFDTEEALQTLGVGEALISVLDEQGIPTIVDRANILPPRSSMNAISPDLLSDAIATCPLLEKYARAEDNFSAYEELQEIREEDARRAEVEAMREAAAKQRAAARKTTSSRSSTTRKSTASRSTASRKPTTARKRQTPLEKAVNSAANTIGREIGKKVVRGLFGTFLR